MQTILLVERFGFFKQVGKQSMYFSMTVQRLNNGEFTHGLIIDLL